MSDTTANGPSLDTAPSPICEECGINPVKSDGGRCRSCAQKARHATGGANASKPTRSIKALQDNLEGMYATIGTAVYMFDQVCGTAILTGGPECAAALATLAAENPKVRKVLEGMFTKAAIGLVIAAHAKVGLTIAAHHNVLPAALNGNRAEATG